MNTIEKDCSRRTYAICVETTHKVKAAVAEEVGASWRSMARCASRFERVSEIHGLCPAAERAPNAEECSEAAQGFRRAFIAYSSPTGKKLDGPPTLKKRVCGCARPFTGDSGGETPRCSCSELPVQRAECAAICVYDCLRHQSTKQILRSSQIAALRSVLAPNSNARTNSKRLTTQQQTYSALAECHLVRGIARIVGCKPHKERDYDKPPGECA